VEKDPKNPFGINRGPLNEGLSMGRPERKHPLGTIRRYAIRTKKYRRKKRGGGREKGNVPWSKKKGGKVGEGGRKPGHLKKGKISRPGKGFGIGWENRR